MVATPALENARRREIKPAQANKRFVWLINIHKQGWKIGQIAFATARPASKITKSRHNR